MSVQEPAVSMTTPPAATLMFRVQGKTIAVVTHGKATVVTLTFDAIGASGDAVRSGGTELGGAAPIAMPSGPFWSFRRRSPNTAECNSNHVAKLR